MAQKNEASQGFFFGRMMFHVLAFPAHTHMCDKNIQARGEGWDEEFQDETDEVIYFRLKKVLRYLISSYSHILLKRGGGKTTQ